MGKGWRRNEHTEEEEEEEEGGSTFGSRKGDRIIQARIHHNATTRDTKTAIDARVGSSSSSSLLHGPGERTTATTTTTATCFIKSSKEARAAAEAT